MNQKTIYEFETDLHFGQHDEKFWANKTAIDLNWVATAKAPSPEATWTLITMCGNVTEIAINIEYRNFFVLWMQAKGIVIQSDFMLAVRAMIDSYNGALITDNTLARVRTRISQLLSDHAPQFAWVHHIRIDAHMERLALIVNLIPITDTGREWLKSVGYQ